MSLGHLYTEHPKRVLQRLREAQAISKFFRLLEKIDKCLVQMFLKLKWGYTLTARNTVLVLRDPTV